MIATCGMPQMCQWRELCKSNTEYDWPNTLPLDPIDVRESLWCLLHSDAAYTRVHVSITEPRLPVCNFDQSLTQRNANVVPHK